MPSIPGVNDVNNCEAYYEALMVDPLWEVSPLSALSETAALFVLRPLELLGAAAGVFFRDFLGPIPFIWKVPCLAIAALVRINENHLTQDQQKLWVLIQNLPSQPRRSPPLGVAGALPGCTSWTLLTGLEDLHSENQTGARPMVLGLRGTILHRPGGAASPPDSV